VQALARPALDDPVLRQAPRDVGVEQTEPAEAVPEQRLRQFEGEGRGICSGRPRRGSPLPA
ncbi:hypothetical protein, partial [Methylobacterium trifolii]|uniref:hypothetical protein n=1 Tax=Methylobacterium trifolii TaxID=1003092 RepID=UPI001EDFB793